MIVGFFCAFTRAFFCPIFMPLQLNTKMIKKGLLIGALIGCLITLAQAQAPKSYSSADILQQLRQLKVVGSVLYIAAHPDDENTRLLAYLAREKDYRTAYMSLTRGDGGQNLLGNEQGIELGLIRTQELLAARRLTEPSNSSPGRMISALASRPRRP